MLDDQSRKILSQALPTEIRDLGNYILSIHNTAQQMDPSLKEMIQQTNYEDHPKMLETKSVLQRGIDASSGALKIIEQLYGESSPVKIHEKDTQVKKAVQELFGQKTDVITFDMYKQACLMLRKISNEIQGVLLDELVAGHNEIPRG